VHIYTVVYWRRFPFSPRTDGKKFLNRYRRQNPRQNSAAIRLPEITLVPAAFILENTPLAGNQIPLIGTQPKAIIYFWSTIYIAGPPDPVSVQRFTKIVLSIIY